MKNDQQPDSDRWQMTDHRREKMNEAATQVNHLIHRDPPPNFQEMQDAIDRLVKEFETNK